jgi:3-oxoacyl-ACP reductase-like protein
MAERSWSEVWTESAAPEIVTFDCLEFPLDWKEDMKKLTNKVAVVTGASKGIGAGIARGLAAEGAAVVVNYAFSTADAERVVAESNHRAE